MADTAQTPPKVKPTHLTVADFDTVLADAGDKPVLVDFFAEWCGPCKMIAPVIEELADDYKEKAVIAKVNVDEEGMLAQRYGVMSIPTLLVFKSGKVVDKGVGFMPKPNLRKLIEKHLPEAETAK